MDLSLIFQHKLIISLFAGVLSIAYALFLSYQVLSKERGDSKMNAIADAIAEGAAAYMKRQYMVVAAIGAVIAVVLLKQPDTKSFILITITGISMLFVSGVPVKYIFGVGVGLVILFGSLVFVTPYLQQRVKTFINPAEDGQGSSYQIQQSLIALGSGGLWGRGYGQSIQKFNYLPEPQGDSIFAVLGEELGFIGTFSVIFLYILFLLRGFYIANRAPDYFSGLLVHGIVILITLQSFMHIASVTGVFPLTGVPLVFMSQGGTALMVYLMAIGVVLNISKFQKKINS